MSKLVLTLFVLCVQRIYCDDSGYGGGGGGYEEPTKVEKASFGLTVDMEKEETFLKKDPGQLVLVLGDSGSKKAQYGGGDKKKKDDYKGGDDYHGGGYKGGSDYQGGGYGGGHGDSGYGGGHGDSGYGGGHGDSGYGGGYVDSGYGGSSYADSGYVSGYGGSTYGSDYGSYSGDAGYMSGYGGGGYSKGGGGGGYGSGGGGGGNVQYKSVYMDDDGYAGGNGLVVSTGKYVKPGGGHAMPGGYSSKRYGLQRNARQHSQPNYRMRRPTKDLNYASDVTHNQYSNYRTDEFIPNDKQYYYYNN